MFTLYLNHVVAMLGILVTFINRISIEFNQCRLNTFNNGSNPH